MFSWPSYDSSWLCLGYTPSNPSSATVLTSKKKKVELLFLCVKHESYPVVYNSASDGRHRVRFLRRDRWRRHNAVEEMGHWRPRSGIWTLLHEFGKTFFAYNVGIRKMYSNFISHRGVGITGHSTSLTNTCPFFFSLSMGRKWITEILETTKKKIRPSASLYDTPILLVMKRILPTDSLSTESSTVIR